MRDLAVSVDLPQGGDDGVYLSVDLRIVYAETAADDRPLVVPGIPGESDARREIVPVSRNLSVSDVQLIAQAEIEGEIRSRIPRVLRIEGIVRRRKAKHRIPESLLVRLRQAEVESLHGGDAG